MRKISRMRPEYANRQFDIIILTLVNSVDDHPVERVRFSDEHGSLVQRGVGTSEPHVLQLALERSEGTGS